MSGSAFFPAEETTGLRMESLEKKKFTRLCMAGIRKKKSQACASQV
jgi:hypothetical protein